MDALKAIWVPIHPEGYPFIGIFAFLTLFLFVLSETLGALGVVMTIWCVTFFRNPPRVTPQREGILTSPADGVICMIDEAPPPPELNMGSGDCHRLSIFMNVFNCHINRAPISGEIRNIVYKAGKKLNASLDKASADNERNSIHIRSKDGLDVAVVQIAGLVARRIVSWAGEGASLRAGDVFGMIRFGSRVDLYFPKTMEVLALEGQKAIAGETVLAQYAKKKEKKKRAPRSASAKKETSPQSSPPISPQTSPQTSQDADDDNKTLPQSSPITDNKDS